MTIKTPTRRGLIARTAAIAAVLGSSRVAFAQAPAAAPPDGPHRLPLLGYGYAALEPHIDARTMELHSQRHHAAQVVNLNRALQGNSAASELPLHELLQRWREMPEAVRGAIRNNAGGHANHSMFWQIMGPGGGGNPPAGPLLDAITRDLGGFDKMKTDFDAAGNGLFGSGWAFITVTREGRLAITSRTGQDNPIMDGMRVLIGNDVWEHAYYLKYQNNRAGYMTAWWNTLNWTAIAARYEAARAGTLTV
jgi:superoxide dismutase, Fe-Mn family